MIVTSNLDGLFWNLLRRAKHSSLKLIRDWRYRKAVAQIQNVTKMQVFSGPFKGMLVSERHVYGAPVAKLLGTYENELHPFLQCCMETSPRYAIDVGGAEGYYAIGMALQSCVESVLVWESLDSGRTIIQGLALANNVRDKIRIIGECHEPDLYEAISARQNGILIMDVEGAELDLLSLRVCAALGHWTFIVEAHDFIYPGCTRTVSEKFQQTHDVVLIKSCERTVDDFPLALRIAPPIQKWLMDEGRPQEMCWVTGIPRATTMERPSGTSKR